MEEDAEKNFLHDIIIVFDKEPQSQNLQNESHLSSITCICFALFSHGTGCITD
jgi:hypothetical protein